jgi:hypothetical protein
VHLTANGGSGTAGTWSRQAGEPAAVRPRHGQFSIDHRFGTPLFGVILRAARVNGFDRCPAASPGGAFLDAPAGL